MDKFDLASLRIPQDLEPATRPAFSFIRLGKPGRRTFIRTFLVPERSEIYYLVEDPDREIYLASPSLALELGADAYPACLVPYVSKQSAIGVWPVKTSTPGARPNSWNESAWRAALAAQDEWIRVGANMMMGEYEVKVAIGDFGAPILPDDTYEQLVHRAFDGWILDTSGHPVIQQLLGAV
ncbi:MAG: hypothetical protein QF524_08260 [Planctomycetota bacterium]|jgi:hypothetical protein|nr:hypothetical protein [Planctomycetota bacterium]